MFLSHLLSLFDAELFGLSLDLVDLADLRECELGELAFVGRMQVEEFSTCVGQASRFRDAALRKTLLVAAEVIADQATLPVTEKLASMLASAGFAEVVDHGLHVVERGARVSPEVGAMCAALAGLEHLHGCLVGVEDCALEHLVLQCIDQRLQAHAADADPLRQRGARNRQTRPSKDALLTVERQMICVLGHQHMREQACGGDALVDHMRIHGHLRDRLALRAGPFAADVAFDGEHAGFVVELLCDVFADALQLAAAGAGRGGRIVVNDLAWQLCGQWLALGLHLRCWCRWRSLKLCNLFTDGRQIGLDLIIEQAALLGVVVLRLRCELHALEQCILVRELGPNRFAVLELSLTALQITEQACCYSAQLLLAQAAQIIQGLRHQLHALQCASVKQYSVCADSRIARMNNFMNNCTITSQNRDRTGSPNTLPWQAQHQCLQLLRLQ